MPAPIRPTSIDLMWDDPLFARALRRLAEVGRLVTCDLHGWGSSDQPSGPFPALERWMDDIGSVMDAAGSAHAAIVALGEVGRPAMLFAASHPDRVDQLVLVKLVRAERTRCGLPRGDVGVFMHADVRKVLPAITASTLVVHRAENPHVRAAHGRFLAANIRDARYVEVPGNDHMWCAGDVERLFAEIIAFLTGAHRATRSRDRTLATVLITDIVGSTDHAGRAGDTSWRHLLEDYGDLAATHIESFRGRFIKSTGDGTLATFDGPARAIECASGIRDAVHTLGLQVRCGIHAGEIELLGDDIAGMAVHLCARVMDLAEPDEVLVSGSVPPLVLGSDIAFHDRGVHQLKGVAEAWRLFAVVS